MGQNQIKLEKSPVVVVMGHVDHGKTTLLDSIRGTSVQGKEAGGITQNTRAHKVTFRGNNITFVDTPGHEAFSQMRSRGAAIGDIALLVVAADDGVSPQTKESIKFIKKWDIPLVVAINKVDLPGVDLAKIKNQLAREDVLVEEYGGDVQVVEVSALKKQGLDDLQESILLQLEMLEIKEEKSKYGNASGIVLISSTDDKLGSTVYLVVKSGDFSVGDYGVWKNGIFSIRSIMNEYMKNQETAVGSDPVWLTGVSQDIPTGTQIYFVSTQKEARKLQSLLSDEKEKVDEEKLDSSEEEKSDADLLAELFSNDSKEEDVKRLKVVVKAMTHGTLEVVESELESLSSDDVVIDIIESGIGEITRKEILTAKNAGGIVIGFQVGYPKELEKIIEREKVIVRKYEIIYELSEELEEAMLSLVEPETYEEEVARLKVKKAFVLSDGSYVAGGEVTSGKMLKGYRVFIERDGEEVGRGKISSLRRNKDEVKEVQKGVECGILINPNQEVQDGDEIVSFKVVRN